MIVVIITIIYAGSAVLHQHPSPVALLQRPRSVRLSLWTACLSMCQFCLNMSDHKLWEIIAALLRKPRWSWPCLEAVKTLDSWAWTPSEEPLRACRFQINRACHDRFFGVETPQNGNIKRDLYYILYTLYFILYTIYSTIYYILYYILPRGRRPWFSRPWFSKIKQMKIQEQDN